MSLKIFFACASHHSEMSPHTSRRALLAAVGTAVASAGCSIGGSSGSGGDGATTYSIEVQNDLSPSNFEHTEGVSQQPARVQFIVRDVDPQSDEVYFEESVEVETGESETIADAFTAQPDGPNGTVHRGGHRRAGGPAGGLFVQARRVRDAVGPDPLFRRERQRHALPVSRPGGLAGLDAVGIARIAGIATFKSGRGERGDMTREVWLKADDEVGDWEARRRRITAGLEAGVDWVLVDEADVSRVRELGDVNVAAFSNGDVHVMDAEDGEPERPDVAVVGKDSEGDGTMDIPEDFSGSADLSVLRQDGKAGAGYVRIFDERYEEFAGAVATAADYTIVVAEDWQIIPLENLIARIGDETTLVAGVQTAEEAQTAYETLEIGADAVLLDSDDPDEIRETVAVRDEAEREQLALRYATVNAVERAGSADRVCIDTGTMMDHDEGMLVGSMSRGLFFVHAETAESPYVASRPFRVNAGAVHAYVRTPDGGTKYLSELTSGDAVQVVDTDGNTREAVVGRAKIERRPMFRVGAEIETDDGIDHVETLLQNAETIKVATSEGRKAVTDLEAGDELLLYYEDTARHFGEAVEESIIEK
jgi:3-dehydroquinate synthase II